jgi:hypothetical protein
MSALGSRLCENSEVELSCRTFVSTASNKKRTALAGTLKRRKERKQFCAFSARERFHTAWVIRVILTTGRSLPVFPNKRTFSVSAGMSQTCHEETYGKKEKKLPELCQHPIILDQVAVNKGFDFRR